MMKDTIAKASDGKGMQEDVTPDSHGFTQQKTEVGASVHSHESVAGVAGTGVDTDHTWKGS